VSNGSSPLKVTSLFSGCGGMDLGFEGGFQVLSKSINSKLYPSWLDKAVWSTLPKTKFKTVFVNDIVKATKVAWETYFSKHGHRRDEFHLNSIVELVKRHQAGEAIFPAADVVTGGFPCQDFSISGKRNGFNSHKGHHGDLLKKQDEASVENRGMLYMWMKHVIDITRPKLFVAENVAGLVSLPDIKEVIENDFRNIGSGYTVTARVLFAPDYGVPQHRKRIIFIGFRNNALQDEALEKLNASLLDPYPPITHAPADSYVFDNNLLPYVTAGDYLLDLPEPSEADDLSQQSLSRAKWYGKHCQGQIEVKLNGLSPTIRAEHHGNIEFRRLSREHEGVYLEELDSGLDERRLTIRECARLQTFPDDYEFVRKSTNMNENISTSEAYKLIGNAVPPLLAFHVAWRLQELWSELFVEDE